jgi:hypothetical protein
MFVGDVDTKEIEALNLVHYSPVDENEGVLGPPFPVHNYLLYLNGKGCCPGTTRPGL